jgi:hypothetical protein
MTMESNRRSLWAAAAGLALVLILVAMPAAADEMWVAPGDKADHEVGDWGVTNNGEARFSFAVPDDLASLTSAKVVLLGKKTKDVDWQANLSISQDGTPHDAFSSSVSGTVAMTAGDIAEVDVTAAFPPALAAGVESAGLAFQGLQNGDLHVVGLRIAYERTNPLAGEACADGEVLTGFDAAGDLTCVSYDDILAKLDCPAGEVFVSFDESTGAVVCTNVLADVACPAGQVLTGFDAAGAPVCTGILPLLAGIGCPSGQVVQGFDSATGLPICVDSLGDETGGGGGGGDETPSFIIDDVAFAEGDSGTTDFVFTVTLIPADPVNSHTVDYSTSGLGAISGVDFNPASGTLTFAAGVSMQTITVEVIGDTVVEGSEEFQVNLSGSSAPPIGDGIGIGTILNDDLGDGR